MDKLKTYLQKLFKMSGSQAMPYPQVAVDLTDHSNCNDLNYLVTGNGYVQVRFSYIGEQSFDCRLYVNGIAIVGTKNPSVSGLTYVDFYFPVSKGTTITAYSNLTIVSCSLKWLNLVGNR